jgi:prepilin-type N-terminal cleavage/methylation domain-containing protein
MRDMKMASKPANSASGFSLLELLVSMALSLIVIGGVLVQLNTANQRTTTEQRQLDLFQEAREYMDQMSRDLRQAGYPNIRNTDNSISNSNLLAIGLSSEQTPKLLNDRNITFEGGLDDTGNVLITTYSYNSSTSGNCPCLERRQRPKNGLSTAAHVEVQNVQNFVDGNSIPIFQYYSNGGTVEVSGPLTYDGVAGANTKILATIDTIRIQLVVQSPYADLKTGAKPVITLVSTVKVNNCMKSSSSYELACS